MIMYLLNALIVGDSGSQERLAARMTEMGHIPRELRDPLSALDLARSDAFDVVVCNDEMEQMDGESFALAAALRGFRAPVVVVRRGQDLAAALASAVPEALGA